MKRYTFNLQIVLLGICLITLLWPRGMAAQELSPARDTELNTNPNPPATLLSHPINPNGDGIVRTPDGLWRSTGTRDLQSQFDVPQATGGPDDFGYTWNNTTPLSWVDANSGIDTGITLNNNRSGPINIGFPFKYYENTYTEAFISLYGFISFPGTTQWWRAQSEIPNAGEPNNVIAPHWGPVDRIDGYIRYLSVGSAPNRRFVVEWNRVRERSNEYTFQVILHESGAIVFQYLNVAFQGGACTSSGIEDSTGLDGLTIVNFCQSKPSNSAVSITRPPVAARVRIEQQYQGVFTHGGKVERFAVPVRNTGELGTDTYDIAVSSSWPVKLYLANGTTLLTDTDGDTLPDTGSIPEGGQKSFVVEVQTPYVVNVSDKNTISVTLRSSINPNVSKVALLDAAVPAPFAQVFYDTDGAMNFYQVQPSAQSIRQITPNSHYGYSTSVAKTPTGYIYLWTKSRQVASSVWTNEIMYALLGDDGQTIQSPSRLTDLSAATINTYDSAPVAAATASGQIGILWYRYLYDSAIGKYNYNIFFAILGPSGSLVYGPENLTQNTAWGNWGEPGYTQTTSPRIAATSDNRFMLVWQQYAYTAQATRADIFLAVRDTQGTSVKPTTQMTDSAGTDIYFQSPTVAPLQGNRVFMAYNGQSGWISYTLLDSAGNSVRAETAIARYRGWGLDTTELYNGNIMLVWSGEPPERVGETSWLAQYYNNETLTGPVALERIENTIDHFWREDSPGPGVNADFFSARWTGTINVPAGRYTFYMGSDDGSRLWIDGQLVMDHWAECCTYWNKTVTLTGGEHTVRMEMREHDGAAWVYLNWYAEGVATTAYYLMLDSAINPVVGPIPLRIPDPRFDSGYPSVSADETGQTIVTWMNISVRRDLYYALIGQDGTVRTPPMIFHTSRSSTPSLTTSWDGYGNTPYGSASTTSGVDTYVQAPTLQGVVPGSTTQTAIRFGNRGFGIASSSTLSVTLSSNLTLVEATPEPSAIASAGTATTTLTWEIPALNFLGNGQVLLTTGVPSTTIGATYPVQVTMTSPGEENTADNSLVVQVMEALQIFLSQIMR